MKIIVIFYLLSASIFAQNPMVYAMLGDSIYDNVENINRLRTIKNYPLTKADIERYVKEVYATKKIGFAIENKDEMIDKLAYLEKLRFLSKENDAFIRSAHSSFRLSISSEDSEMFLILVNNNMINTQRYKNEILNYYSAHVEEINPKGVIQKLLDEERVLKKVVNKKSSKSKEQKEKINKIREQDDTSQKALEKSIQEEFKEKQFEIREDQSKVLSR